MYGGRSYKYDGLTSRGTMDGKPSLHKTRHKIAYECCEVFAYGLLTDRCWSCGETTGVFWDSLQYPHPLRGVHGAGAIIKFSEPQNQYETNIQGIMYEPGHWWRRSPA